MVQSRRHIRLPNMVYRSDIANDAFSSTHSQSEVHRISAARNAGVRDATKSEICSPFAHSTHLQWGSERAKRRSVAGARGLFLILLSQFVHRPPPIAAAAAQRLVGRRLRTITSRNPRRASAGQGKVLPRLIVFVYFTLFLAASAASRKCLVFAASRLEPFCRLFIL